jgi:hypothetical protein
MGISENRLSAANAHGIHFQSPKPTNRMNPNIASQQTARVIETVPRLFRQVG